MRRFFYLCLIMGLGVVSAGTFFAHFLPWPPQTAYADLPDGHPPVEEEAITSQTTVSTTINDFYLPGSQPGSLQDPITDPATCGGGCHQLYNFEDPSIETVNAWKGSMMAQAARDPVFWAALDIANADAAGSGDFCLRCHTPKAWLEGRVDPPDGSGLIGSDFDGVQCEVCHRLVDPVYSDENPERDLQVLAGIDPITTHGSGQIIIDPLDERRGPFDLQEDWQTNPHSILGLDWPQVSPHHQEASLCGSCHDITNPVFSWDEASQSYQPNALDTPGDLAQGFPLERTYSEWLLSDYNTPEGIYAPQFGGNKQYVSICQDCHMRDITAAAGSFFGNRVIRDDMPLHDLTGANVWVPLTLPLHPEFGDDFDTSELTALTEGVERARYMLQNAATLYVIQEGSQLTVTLFNQTGHKLPTGYPEGRRMWLQVEGFDVQGNLVYTSGAYNLETGELTYDTDLKVYEVKQGLTEDWATTVGLPTGPSFHFALNNQIVFDNRVPPRGYVFAEFVAAGAAPMSNGQADPNLYADGQYWDTTNYTLPEGVVSGTVRLLYQVSSKEYIEFLRDNNPTPENPNNRGQILYDLWTQTGRSAPELMAEATFPNEPSDVTLTQFSSQIANNVIWLAGALIVLMMAFFIWKRWQLT